MTTSHDKNVLWDSIETKYWDSIKAARDQEDAVIQQDLIANQQQIKSALANLYQRRTQLSLEIKGANDLIFEHEQKLDSLNAEYDKRRRQIEQQRASDDDGQRAFFAQHREGSSAPPGGHPQDEANRLIAARREGIDPITGARIEQNAQSRAANGTLGPQELPLRTGFVPANGSVPPNAPSTGVHIVDADGQIYAEVPRIGIQNRYIETIASMPVRQPVRMRSGKKFTEEQFQSIFEPADQKGSKWVAVMVQAKGEIQKHPCHYCWKKAGVFEECILIGGEDFPRCGNCEWSRQSCQGAGLNGQSVESADQPQSQAGFAVAGFTAANQAPPNMNGHQPTGFTPLNASQAPTPGESFSQFPTGTSSNSGTPQPDVKKRGNKEPVEDEEEESLPEITGDTLDLRDNGEVFTEPACMAGVPLRKIHKGHPYWEPDWQPVEDLIAPQLAKWTEKLDQIKSNQNTTNAYRFQANRQVNRGNTILRYFETAEFSPFQLMGKKVMSHGIMTYDTLFRLVATLEELKKFSTVDVTPLQWVRQRLIEIYNADPANFNLCKTVHDFYHDKKLVQLRKRNGFGNIGRPSGHKMSKDRDSSEKPAGPGRGRRGRKSMQQANADGIETTPRQYKRQRTDKNVSPATGGAVVDNAFNPDLDYDGYTSTDSYSGDTMKKGDWRLYQVKTHKYISDVNITQYWHWIDGAFQHQVLQSTNPISWGLYEEPINFNVRLTDIDDIMYSPECTKIIITRKADGNGLDTPDVLVHFKRERTKRRFLQFADKKGIKLVKTNRLFVENCWSSSHMDAEELQGDSPSDAASTPA